MSGDKPATIQNIWKCPFCGQDTIEVELIEQAHVNHTVEYDSTCAILKALVLRIRCKDSLKDSAHRKCPAMIECGCYDLYIFPDGSAHAYYY